MWAHAFGCIWWYIASLRSYDCTTWVGQYLVMFQSIDEHYVVSELGQEAFDSFDEDACHPGLDMRRIYHVKTFLLEYELAFFWGWNSLTNLGYSDVVPNNQIEMAWSIFLLLFQVMFYSFILALGFNFIFKKDEKIENYKKLLHTLEMYGQSRNLPPDLRARLSVYFNFQQQKKNSENDDVLIGQMPANILTEFCKSQYSGFIQSCVILKSTPPQFTNALMTKLHQKFLMPNELLFKIDDMSREMCFITQGDVFVFSDSECKQLVKGVNSSTHFGSQVGEIAFFMNMPQPFQVRASTVADVTLLSLSKEDYERCINQYPESHGTITGSMLSIFGLDSVGGDMDKSSNTMAGMSSVVAEDEELFKLIKEDIRSALVKQTEDALGAMIDFASQGDVDEVRKLLAQGLDVNAGDYDSRTTLHLAAAEGNVRVVQVLLQEGADVQVTDRWGHEPLHDAIVAKHEAVADLLAENGAELHYDNPAGMLCSAAASGDVDQLNRMVAYGISPNAADYDGRTALHLASSEGNMKVVEMLIFNPHTKADVNVQDRWKNTPLDDAVSRGHELICMLLYEAGGRMNLEYASGALCEASSSGNIIRLKLLQRHGVDVMEGDYDDRNALHLAAAEGQIVSVDFLLNCKAEVNFKDRWGRVALDDALSGKHWEVARLLIAAGGSASEPITGEQKIGVNKVNLDEIRSEVARVVLQQDQRYSRNKQLVELAKQMVVESTSAKTKIQRAILNVERVLESMQSTALAATYHDSRISLTKYDEAAVAKHFSLQGIHTPSTRIRLAADHQGTESFAMERFMAGASSAAVEAPVVSFNSFHQVILQFPQIETSLEKLRQDIGRVGTSAAETRSNEDEIDAPALLGLLLEYGIECSLSAVDAIFSESGERESSSEARLNFAADLHGSDRSDDGEEDSTAVTFAALLKGSTFCNLFAQYTAFDNVHGSSVAQGFRVISAAFDLLDTDSEGKLAVNNLMSMKNIFGTEQEGASGDDIKETFFGTKKFVLRKEFFTIMAKLVGVLDTENVVGGHSEDGDSSLDRMSNNWDDDDSQGRGEEVEEEKEDGDPGTLKSKTGTRDRAGKSGKAKASVKKGGEEDADGTLARKRGESFLTRCHWFLSAYLPTNPFTARRIEEGILNNLQLEGTYAKQYEEAFNSIDDDGSGTICMEEFEKLMKMVFKVDLPSSYQLKLFKRFDREGNGEISYEDFSATLREMLESRRKKKSRQEIERKLENIVIPDGVPWYILHPKQKWRELYWNKVTVTSALMYIWLVPHTIAFFSGGEEEVYFDLFPGILPAVHWNRIFLLLDVVLWSDIALNFFTAYLNKRSMYVWKREKIVGHYLKNDFLYDAFAAFPFDLFFEMTGASKSAVAWVKVLRLLSIRRVLKAIKLQAQKQNDSMSDLTGHAFTLGVTLHIMACAFFYATNEGVADVTGGQGDNNFLHNKQMHPPYTGYGSVYREDRTAIDVDFKFDEWALSFYWCFATMAAMGHGDLMPSNSKERIIMIVVMVLHLSLYAYFLGALSAMFMSRDEALVHSKSEVSVVQRFIEKMKLPKQLESEIRGTFEFRAHQKANGITQEQEGEVYRGLSHTLQVEVAHYISRTLLDGVTSFKDCGMNFLDSLSTVLREETIAPSNRIFEANDTCKQLNILSFGQLRILGLDPETEEMIQVSVLDPGAVAGETEFFFGIRHQTTCETLSNGKARIFTLSKDDYQQLVKLYPADEDIINKNILGLEAGDMDDNKTAKSGATGASKGSQASAVSGASAGASGSKSADGGTSVHSAASGDSKVSGASAAICVTDHDHMSVIATAQKKKAMERVCAMCSSSALGKLDSLKKLLGEDRLTTEGDYDLRTPLHLAASEGRTACVGFLVERMDQANLSPVDRFGGTPLSDAVRHKHDKVASFLRNHGANMPEDTDKAAQLCTAAADNDLGQLKRIIGLQYDPNTGDYDDRTAIHLAASNGNLEICKYLRTVWADMNAVDRWGGTPLADAIRHEHKDVSDFLRQNGARLPANMDVAGMMCEAASVGNIELLQTFFTNGVDLNVGDYDARTALHLACSCNQLAVVDFLLKSCKGRVDVSPVDRLGNTPLDDCNRENLDWLAIILKKHGGVANGHSSLAGKVRKLEDASAKRAREKAEDLETAERQDRCNTDIVAILQDAIEAMNQTIPKLRTELDTLLHTIASRKTVTSRKVIKRTRNPTLEELIDFFTTSLFSFVQDNQKVNELNAYVAIRNITSEGHGTATMCAIVRGFFDTYLAPEASSKITSGPEDKRELLKSLEKLEFESLSLPRGFATAVSPGHAVLGGRILRALSNVKASVEIHLKETIAKYYDAPEYFTASRSRLSKAWRSLVITRSMYERTFKLLEKVNKLKELASTKDQELQRESSWRQKVKVTEGGGEAKAKQLEDIREAFKKSIKSAELRQSLEERSGELLIMFKHVETLAIRASTMMKENFSAHQHKTMILEAQKTKNNDRKGGVLKGLGN